MAKDGLRHRHVFTGHIRPVAALHSSHGACATTAYTDAISMSHRLKQRNVQNSDESDGESLQVSCRVATCSNETHFARAQS